MAILRFKDKGRWVEIPYGGSGEVTSNSDIWIGSDSQYNAALSSGVITSNTFCLITDEETETTTIIQNGDVLEVYSGVTITQNNDELEVR